MNDYALLALVWTLTLAVGALAGTIVGYFLGGPNAAELAREEEAAQADVDMAYDLGYGDGYEDAGEDTIVEFISDDA